MSKPASSVGGAGASSSGVGAGAASSHGRSAQLLLSTTQAIRCAAILEKATERLQLLSIISSGSTLKSAEAKLKDDSDGDGVVGKILEDQKHLEAAYEGLLTKKESKKVSTLTPFALEEYGVHQIENKALNETQREQQELREVAAQLRDTTKKLCSTLKANPSDSDNFRRVQNQRLELHESLESCVRDLSDGVIRNLAGVTGTIGLGEVNCSAFSRQVFDERARREREDELLSQENEIFTVVRELQSAVEAERQSRTAELSKRSDQLIALKENVRQLRYETDYAFEKLKAETGAESQARRRLEAERLKKLQEQAKLLERETLIETRVFKELQRHLVTSVEELTERLEDWRNRSRAETTDLEEALMVSRKEREIQLEHLAKAREEYQQELESKARREELDRRKEDERKRKEEETRQKQIAVLMLQTAWRGYFRRNGPPKPKKGGKGKKGKKK